MLSETYLKTIEKTNIINKFGDWTNNIDKLKIDYNNSKPFKYICIDNFLATEYINKIYNNYPEDYSDWYKYYNPLEIKFATDKINDFNKPIKDIFYYFSSNIILDKFKKISNINDLESDPYLHGAGLHCHPRYGRLNMHLDYEKHPKINNKERRLNIILFLNKAWKEEWNGDNQFWDKTMKNCIVKTYPKYNRALIFQTNDISWHGLPEKIMCPEGEYRKSIAYYYISPLSTQNKNNKFGNDGSGYRTKASFFKRPSDPDLPQLKKLYSIRPFRRITNSDLENIWPEWTPSLF